VKTKKPKLIDQRPRCCECGGRRVETNAWIEYREDGTESVVNTEGPVNDESGNWCHDCEDNVDLDFSYCDKLKPADHAHRQRSSRSRASGPELLAAIEAGVHRSIKRQEAGGRGGVLDDDIFQTMVALIHRCK